MKPRFPKTCRIEGCTQMRMTHIKNGKEIERSHCKEHHQEIERNRMRKRNDSRLSEDAPPLPMGRYILFDLPHAKVYVVRGNNRSIQDYFRNSVQTATIEILKIRGYEVKIVEGEIT